MKNVKISKFTRICTPNEIFIGLDNENLQETIKFTFDEFVDGTPRFEFELYNGSKAFISDIYKEGESYILPIKSVLANYNIKYVQLVITQVGNEIPIFKTEKMKFIVESSINADQEVDPDEYISWIDIANEKLAEIDECIRETNNLNISGEKVGHTATITITKKDGSYETVQLEDGTRGPEGPRGETGEEGPTGVGISNIAKTSTEGVVDTYTITYTNDESSDFTVTNGYDGFSPLASVSKIGDTATITITDENGSSSASISDGYTPTASVSKVGDTATITITDESGTTTASVSDGYVQYTAGDNITITNNTISAEGTDVYVLDYSDAEANLKAKCLEIYNKLVDNKKVVTYIKTSNGYIIPAEYKLTVNSMIIFHAPFPYNWQTNKISYIDYYIKYWTNNSFQKTDTTYTVYTDGYIDNTIGSINTILASLTTPSNNGGV